MVEWLQVNGTGWRLETEIWPFTRRSLSEGVDEEGKCCWQQVELLGQCTCEGRECLEIDLPLLMPRLLINTAAPSCGEVVSASLVHQLRRVLTQGHVVTHWPASTDTQTNIDTGLDASMETERQTDRGMKDERWLMTPDTDERWQKNEYWFTVETNSYTGASSVTGTKTTFTIVIPITIFTFLIPFTAFTNCKSV